MPIRDLQVEIVPITALTPYRGSSRTHSRKQIHQLAESIRTFGWTNPILVDDGGGVVAGHGRLAAAKLLSLSEVPVIRLSTMSPEQKRAYVIADNKLAENAGWDRELLRTELSGLLEIDLDFDIGVTGFETGEIDVLLADEEDDADDAAPPVTEGPPVSQRGDLWVLGRHRLLCGDVTSRAEVESLMAGKKADLVFTDPPYNVTIEGHVCGNGRHGEFAMASGEMSEAEFTTFLETALGNLAEVAREGSIHFVCMDWRHVGEMLVAGRAVFEELKNLCVWRKSNGGMGSLYRSQHELVFVFKKGTAPHVNNVELGRFGRHRTNVWDYAGLNAFANGRLENLAAHPTVKPVALVEDAIKDCSHRGDIVLDGFAGSGTTIVAAQRCGRYAMALEIEPSYVDVAVARFQTVTGEAAVHAATGESFEDLRAARGASDRPRNVKEGRRDRKRL